MRLCFWLNRKKKIDRERVIVYSQLSNIGGPTGEPVMSASRQKSDCVKRSCMMNAVSQPAESLPIRVAVVENAAEVFASWFQLAENFSDGEFDCVCSCSSGEDAIRVIPGALPEVILVDIPLPGMTGIECVSKLKAMLPSTPAVIFTTLDDDELIFSALEAGADGYLLKQSRPAELRVALQGALRGGAALSGAVARRVVGAFRRRPDDAGKGANLSVRELEVLRFLSRGCSNKEIAEQIQLSVETVRTYLKRIYEKLEVRSRTEAVIRFSGSGQVIPRFAEQPRLTAAG